MTGTLTATNATKKHSTVVPSVCFQRMLAASAILVIGMQNSVAGFSVPSLTASRRHISLPTSSLSPVESRLGAKDPTLGDDADESNREREFARVRRRRGGYEEEEAYDSYDGDTGSRGGDSVMDAADILEDEGFFDDMDDDIYDDEFDNDESYDIFSNTIIPNPLLDSIDPDGAAERFPELASDPKFWFDMFLFIAFLNFLSFIGPRNPFPDLDAMYTAGLPPPGI